MRDLKVLKERIEYAELQQSVVQTVQPHPPAPGHEYATASTGNTNQEWY